MRHWERWWAALCTSATALQPAACWCAVALRSHWLACGPALSSWPESRLYCSLSAGVAAVMPHCGCHLWQSAPFSAVWYGCQGTKGRQSTGPTT